MKMPPRRRLAIDFDGVVHAYSEGWNDGVIYDEPVDGAADALRQLNYKYQLVLFTARHNLDDVRTWLRRHRLLHYFEDVTNRKPQAIAYIDDRSIRFQSWDQALKDVAGL